MENRPVIVVILAGGIGTRTGLSIPKQFIKVAGKTIIEHTVDVVHAHDGVDELIVMINAESKDDAVALFPTARYPKLTQIQIGGGTRNETTQIALGLIADPDAKVLFHDAVRPFIDDRILTECIDALDEHDAVDTAIDSADTIIQVTEDSLISAIPARSTLRRGQTPQAFRHRTLTAAYALANQDPNFAATDDCGVVFSYTPEVPIYVVAGTSRNMKVTDGIDVHLADKLFQLQGSEGTVAAGIDDLDLEGKNIVVFGSSSGIGADMVRLATEHGAHVFGVSRGSGDVDVRSRESVRDALAQAHAELGSIDIVVLTAAILRIKDVVDYSADEVLETIETNLVAAVLLAQESHDYLAATCGSLLYFTSSSYTRGRAGYALYSATKAGVVNLTQALSEEWAPEGIRVNCINPQRTSTPMRTAAFGTEPAGSLLSAEYVALRSLDTALGERSGQIIDVRVTDNDSTVR